MISYRCPHCKEALKILNNSLVCSNNHCFDFAKQGHVNLFCSNDTKNHGDDKFMVEARSSFLSEGYYAPLRDGLCDILKELSPSYLLDAGCGEGYYTSGFSKVLDNTQIFAVDLSKDAVRKTRVRDKRINCCVASVYQLPFFDNSFDCITNIFSPYSKDEFLRLLKDDGYIINVIPLEDHLWDLKCAIYSKPYKNAPQAPELEGFDLVNTKDIDYEISLNSNEQIKNLFAMTPYYYNTSPKDKEKLNDLQQLNVRISFGILIHKKHK